MFNDTLWGEITYDTLKVAGWGFSTLAAWLRRDIAHGCKLSHMIIPVP